MGLTDAATRKVGPLPAWGWGAIAVGGFVAWRMFSGSGGNGTTDAGVASVGGTGDAGGGGGGGGGVDTSALQTAIDNLTQKIGNITIPGTGSGGSGGDTTNPSVSPMPGENVVTVIPDAIRRVGHAGDLLVAKYPALAKYSRDASGNIDFGSLANVPGFSDVSSSDRSYWASKLGNNFLNVGNPDPADFLAQYLEVARTGTFLPNAGVHGLEFAPGPRGAISQADLDIGLAFAQAYAAAAGVTPEQLAAAQDKLQQQLAAGSYADPNSTNQRLLAAFGNTNGYFTEEQLNAINAAGGAEALLARMTAGSGSGAPPTFNGGIQINTPTINAPSLAVPNVSPAAHVPTQAEMLAAIAARSPGATPTQIAKTLQNDLAKGYTPAQIVRPVTPTT